MPRVGPKNTEIYTRVKPDRHGVRHNQKKRNSSIFVAVSSDGQNAPFVNIGATVERFLPIRN